MRISITLLLAAVMISPLLAQQSNPEPLPTTEGEATMENPFNLIQPPTPSGETASLEAGEREIGKSKTIQSEADLRQRIHYREIKTRAMNDAALQEMKARAAAAKTMPEKREALKNYYERLCLRITKLDGSLKQMAERRKTSATNRLRQRRFEDAAPDTDADELELERVGRAQE